MADMRTDEQDRRNNRRWREIDDEINRCIRQMTGSDHKSDIEFVKQG
jgi:hypothetical protein